MKFLLIALFTLSAVAQDDRRGPAAEPKKVTLTIFAPTERAFKITSFSIAPSAPCIAFTHEKKRSIFCGNYLVTMEF